MKISEMTADKAADVLVRISQPVSNILDDDEVESLIKEVAETQENKSNVKILAFFMPRVVPIALKKHKKDLFEIVGALAQVPVSEVGKMSVLQLMTVIRESVDRDLLDFFKNSGKQTGQAGAE